MTDYELASLFVEHRNAWLFSIELLYTILGLFLAASAFAATRLSRGLMTIVLVTYVILYQSAAFTTSGDAENFFGVVHAIKEKAKAPGSPLEWHTALDLPDTLLAMAPTLGIAVNMILFICSLYFFYLCRRGHFKWVS